MPYNTVATNQAMTSAFFNTNYRNQVVSTVTSLTRPAGTEGQFIYETDTDGVWVYDGSAWQRFGGLNAWVTYTPTTSGITVGNGTLYGRFWQLGKFVAFKVRFALGTTSAITGSIILGLPVTGVATNPVAATVSCQFIDVSASTAYLGTASLSTTTATCLATATGGTYASYAATSSTIPFTWANTDYIDVGGFYEVA
jgi:hypothetical protein